MALLADDDDLGLDRWTDDPAELFDAVADLLARPAFHADALCREPAYASVNFFPVRGEPLDDARALCRRCLVREECEAAGQGEVGVWGGLSQRERRRQRQRAEQAA